MDNAAIEAYSGVIADAAEDSQPEKAVVYTETDTEKTLEEQKNKPRSEVWSQISSFSIIDQVNYLRKTEKERTLIRKHLFYSKVH